MYQELALCSAFRFQSKHLFWWRHSSARLKMSVTRAQCQEYSSEGDVAPVFKELMVCRGRRLSPWHDSTEVLQRQARRVGVGASTW